VTDTTDGIDGAAPLIEMDEVSCRYGNGANVLEDVSLRVPRGSFTGVVGPSGSGKSTLLQVMLDVVPARRGTVRRMPALRIGYVPQVETINWNFPVTVDEVVLMAARAARRRPWASADERRDVAEVLDRLGLSGLGGRHIRELSGGQQQRVFIARALFSDPDLLLLDEPTSGVDVRTRHEVLHLLGELNRGGLAIVLTTHDLNGIAAHLPHVVCLQTRVIGAGRPIDVLTPEILERTYGAPMDVLVHAGLPFVVDRHQHQLGHQFGHELGSHH
jgi:ABC-type Mn2+/Zn2+ transport system ATPase subunit